MDTKIKRIILIISAVILVVAAGVVIYCYKDNLSQTGKFPYEIDFSKAQNISETQLQRLKDDFEKAKAAYQTNPTNFDALMTFAFINYQLGEYQKAKEIYVAIGENSPKNYNSFWNLGNTCLRMKDYACAESAYLKAIENGPDQSRHYLALGDLYYSFIQDKKSQIPDLYKKGLEALPGDYDLLINLARYYRETGDKDNAVKYYQELIKKYPQYADEFQEEMNEIK